ncbi:hypothetical protein KDM41_15070, partial [bacterium]|nr:hypothetical protein [bacterium]
MRGSPAIRRGLRLCGLLVATLVASSPAAADTPGDPRVAAADSLWLAGETAAAITVLDEGIDAARAAADPLLLGNLLRRRGAIEVALGRSGAALAPLQEARALALAGNDGGNLRPVRRWYGVALGQTGQAEAARREFAILLDESVAAGDVTHQAWARIGLGYWAWNDGRLEEARHLYRTAAAQHRAADNADGELFALNGLGTVLDNLGSYGEAAAVLARVAELAASRGQLYIAGIARNNLGSLLLDLGEPDRAGDHLREAESLLRRSQSEATWVIPAKGLALAEATLGRTSYARDRLGELWDVVHGLGRSDLEVAVLHTTAEVERLAGRPFRAREVLAELLAHPDLTPAAAVAALDLLARILVESGQAAAAADLLAERAPWTTALENPLHRARLEVARSAALVAAGDTL